MESRVKIIVFFSGVESYLQSGTAEVVRVLMTLPGSCDVFYENDCCWYTDFLPSCMIYTVADCILNANAAKQIMACWWLSRFCNVTTTIFNNKVKDFWKKSLFGLLLCSGTKHHPRSFICLSVIPLLFVYQKNVFLSKGRSKRTHSLTQLLQQLQSSKIGF